MDFVTNSVYLLQNISHLWIWAAGFAVLGLWMGYLTWSPWGRQAKALAVENTELNDRLAALRALEESGGVPVMLPAVPVDEDIEAFEEALEEEAKAQAEVSEPRPKAAGSRHRRRSAFGESKSFACRSAEFPEAD